MPIINNHVQITRKLFIHTLQNIKSILFYIVSYYCILPKFFFEYSNMSDMANTIYIQTIFFKWSGYILIYIIFIILIRAQ